MILIPNPLEPFSLMHFLINILTELYYALHPAIPATTIFGGPNTLHKICVFSTFVLKKHFLFCF